MSQPHSSPAQSSSNHQKPFKFWKRLLAFIVDLLLLAASIQILGFFLVDIFSQLGRWGRLVGFIIFVIYFGMMNSSLGNGQTVGKKLTKLKVMNARGEFLSPVRSLLRSFLFAIPFFLSGAMISPRIRFSAPGIMIDVILITLGLCLCYLFVFNRKTRQTFHDLIVGSYVVSESASFKSLHFPSLWKGHLFFVGVLLMTSLVFGVNMTTTLSQEDSVNLVNTIERLTNDPKIYHANLNASTITFRGEKTTFIESQVFLTEPQNNTDVFSKQVAQKIIEHYPNAINANYIKITVSYGYDFGISSFWRSSIHQYSPQELQQPKSAHQPSAMR